MGKSEKGGFSELFGRPKVLRHGAPGVHPDKLQRQHDPKSAASLFTIREGPGLKKAESTGI